MSRTTAHGARAGTEHGVAVVLHGLHPLRGYPVTWHLTPLPPGGRGPATFRVERADGYLTDDLVWHLAEKDTVVMTAGEVAELVRRVG